jgi:hypothetical protein
MRSGGTTGLGQSVPLPLLALASALGCFADGRGDAEVAALMSTRPRWGGFFVGVGAYLLASHFGFSTWETAVIVGCFVLGLWLLASRR